MANKQKSSVAIHRARKKRQGFVRVEVSVRREDAGLLVHRVATALTDPTHQAEARQLLQLRLTEPPKVSLKALLASAPLDGIELDRNHDHGRNVEL